MKWRVLLLNMAIYRQHG